ncbi:MAG: hypothetical protein ACI8XC_003594 [Gammaproteobacteria bacterium]|jgi:hypothetical protein
MLYLSDVLIQNPDMDSFDDLKHHLKTGLETGEIFFRIDIKPPFFDTPGNWEDELEAAFTSIR